MLDDVLEVRTAFSLEQETVVDQVSELSAYRFWCLHAISKIAYNASDLRGRTTNVWHLTCDHL